VTVLESAFLKPKNIHTQIKLRPQQITKSCQRWKVREMALFGSIIPDDFRPDSDVDVLVSFVPDAPWSLFDFVTMQGELEQDFSMASGPGGA